jgi:uncharacterized protein (DUF2237 family)
MAFREPGFGGGGDNGKLPSVNVLGGVLAPCGTSPMTGFWRDGCCNTGAQDAGVHSVCCIVTDGFLDFSKKAGNDLSTPVPQYGFPGLKAGDRWCLCAARWAEAYDCGHAPKVVLASTHIATLAIISLDVLKAHAVDLN